MPEYTIPMQINLPLLLRQKQALLRAISNISNAADTEYLDGILHLLDHIHDEIDPPNPTFTKREIKNMRQLKG